MTELASLRGRIQHYSVIFLPSAVSDAAVYLRGVLEEHAFSGVPLWPFVPSTLYAAFLAGETGLALVVVITWDASQFGWVMVLRSWDNPASKVVMGTLPDSPDMQHQVRRRPAVAASPSKPLLSSSTCMGPPSLSAMTLLAL